MQTRHFTEAEQDAIVAAYQAGASVATLRDRYDTGWTQVARVLRGRGVYEGRKRAGALAREAEMVGRYESGESLAVIASGMGCTPSWVLGVLHRNGTTMRPAGSQRPDYIPRIAELRSQGLGARKIAKELDIGVTTAQKWIGKLGLAGPRGHEAGETHPAWRGGVIFVEGYRHVRLPKGDPYFDMAWKSQYVPEHRLVMARSLGRSLTRSETVHHINGDKTDNRLENLQLRQGRHGKGARFTCLDCGSHNVAAAKL